ncbi:MAG: DUF1559 domain-containing protein, partial [Planctomycetota bacterium]
LPVSNYVGNNSSTSIIPWRMSSTNPDQNICSTASFDGIFSLASRTRFRDITDGLSNTVLIGERSYSRLIDVDRQTEAGGGILHMAGVSNTFNSASAVGAVGVPGINQNYFAPTLDAAHTQRIRSGLHSVHPGGAQVVLCDGSVVFISENIDFSPDTVIGGGQNYAGGNSFRYPMPYGGTMVGTKISEDSVLEYLFSRNDGTVIGEF